MTKPKVVVFINAGIVQDILTEQPCDVVIVDQDTEGCDEEDLRYWVAFYGHRVLAYIYSPGCEIGPLTIRRIMDAKLTNQELMELNHENSGA